MGQSSPAKWTTIWNSDKPRPFVVSLLQKTTNDVILNDLFFIIGFPETRHFTKGLRTWGEMISLDEGKTGLDIDLLDIIL